MTAETGAETGAGKGGWPVAVDQRRRTVGELLLDSDHLARAVLTDARGGGTTAVIRTWPQVAEAVGSLWRALRPYHEAAVRGEAVRRVQAARIDRLVAVGAAFARSVGAGPWPGPGPADDRFEQIADALAAAARLVAAGGPTLRAQRPRQRADVRAAMTRLVHVAYVAAHGTELALLAEQDAVRQPSSPPSKLHNRGRPGVVDPVWGYPAAARPTETWLNARLGQIRVVQDSARAVLGTTWPTALTGAHHQVLPVAGALAAWDVAAHRALTATDQAGDILLATHATAMNLHLGGLIVAAAAEVGDLDAGAYHRLAPALAAAQDTWTHLAESWAHLVPPGHRRVDPDLAEAAAAVRTALTGLVMDGATPATAHRMATRTDLTHAAAAVAESLIGAAGLADVITHTTSHTPLQAPARRVTSWHRALYGGEVDLPVDPLDHIHDRIVDLPQTTRAALTAYTHRAAAATLRTAAALRAASVLTGTGTTGAPPRGPSPTPAHPTPRNRARPRPGPPARPPAITGPTP